MSSATQVSITQSVTANVDAMMVGGVDSGAGGGNGGNGGGFGNGNGNGGTQTQTQTPTTVPGACDLQQNTVLALTLATGSPPPSFSGSITYSFEAATGVSTSTNCTDQLASSGGPYDTLPCTASYSLSAAHQ